MRVLVLSHMFPTVRNPQSGVFIWEQVKALRALGVNLDILVPTTSYPRLLRPFLAKARLPSPPLAEVKGGISIRYPRTPPGGRLYFPLYGYAMAQACGSAQGGTGFSQAPDLIHAHTVLPDGLAGLELGQKAGVPVLVTAHGSDIHLYPKRGLLSRWMSQRVLNRAQGLVAVSRDLKAAMLELCRPRKIDVIPNGADPVVFKPRSKGLSRKTLGLVGKGPHLLFVGNLLSVKGPDLLLKAFLKVRRSGWVLHMVGDGPMRGSLEREAARAGAAGALRFHGRRPHDEIPFWLSACDLLVLPSRSEGFPTLIPEAMLSGALVVAAAAGGIPEAVEEGKTGFLVPAEDVEGLAGGIRRSLSLKGAKGILKRARARALAEWTWEANARKMKAVYEGLVRGERRR